MLKHHAVGKHSVYAADFTGTANVCTELHFVSPLTYAKGQYTHSLLGPDHGRAMISKGFFCTQVEKKEKNKGSNDENPQHKRAILTGL